MPEDPISSRHRRSVTVREEPERHSEPRAEDESRSQSTTPLMLQDQPEPPADSEVPETTFQEDESDDYWILHDHMLVRYHKSNRLTMFVPTAENCPVPLRYLDVKRSTWTTIDSQSEKWILDYWNVPYSAEQDQPPRPPDRPLTEPWTGRTIFELLRRPCAPGFQWVHGQVVKTQKTRRPPTILPDQWTKMTKKQQQE